MAALQLIESTPSTPEPLMTSQEVAAMLNVDISWVRNHCKKTAPLLPHIQLGGGRYATRRFRKADILQFIEDHFVQPRVRRAA